VRLATRMAKALVIIEILLWFGAFHGANDAIANHPSGRHIKSIMSDDPNIGSEGFCVIRSSSSDSDTEFARQVTRDIRQILRQSVTNWNGWPDARVDFYNWIHATEAYPLLCHELGSDRLLITQIRIRLLSTTSNLDSFCTLER
jgi:hypothetical protein